MLLLLFLGQAQNIDYHQKFMNWIGFQKIIINKLRLLIWLGTPNRRRWPHGA